MVLGVVCFFVICFGFWDITVTYVRNKYKKVKKVLQKTLTKQTLG